MRLACVDLGSSTLKVLIVDVTEGRLPVILGRGWAPSAGIERGDVVDLKVASRALGAALEDAERSSNTHVAHAVVAIGGRELRGTLRRGQVTISREPVRITKKHASRAVQSAAEAGIDLDEELIHVLPRRFWLDGDHAVRNPIGMPASRLEAETLLVSGNSAAIRNAIRCVQDQGLDVTEVVAAPLATAEAALSPQDREAGALLIDAGYASTRAVAFSQGSAAAITAVSSGSHHITSDIAIVLRVSVHQAEQLKVRYGRASSLDLPDQLVEVPDDEGIGLEPVSQRLLCDVIGARVEETFDEVMDAVAACGFAEPLPAGVVLSGGGSALPAIDALARQSFELPARAASLSGPTAGAPDEVTWLTTLGLAAWVQRGQPELAPEHPNATRRPQLAVRRLARLLRPLGGE